MITIEGLVVSYVARQFAMFHNPRYRGPNFTWERFPELISGLLGVECFLYFPPMSEKKQAKLRAKAERLAYDYAQELVGLMTE